jgi:peptide/nickel transport system permease protein
MTNAYDPLEKAADLRSHGMFAARAGRLQEARAAFLQSLEHDPHHAGAYLWLASIAATEREAYQYLGQARGLTRNPAHLRQAADHIHRIFHPESTAAKPAAPPTPEPAALQPSLDVTPAALPRQQAAAPRAPRRPGRPTPLLAYALRFLGRLAALAVAIVALVALVSLLVALGRAGDIGAWRPALSEAASFTADYLSNLLHGNLGSIPLAARNGLERPVVTELARALPLSLGLLAASLALAVIIGLTLGTVASLRRGGRLSGLVIFGSVLGVSTPSYFAAMLLIWLSVWIYKRTGHHVFPISGAGWDAHLILPALVLAARPAATVTRLGYNALVEIFEAEYIRTARAKGLRRQIVLFRHALRNAWVPMSTTIVASLRFTLAALPIVEYSFSWPGIGQQLLESIQLMDATGVIGMALPLVVIFSLVNLSLETFYPLMDPRLRNAEKGVT